ALDALNGHATSHGILRTLLGHVGWRIGCEVSGKDCPEAVNSFSRGTHTDLDRISRELAVGPCQTGANLVCCAGDPRWRIARETGGSLIEIDVSARGFGGHLAASLPSYMTAILTSTPRDGLSHPWTPPQPIPGLCGQGRRQETGATTPSS